MKISKKVLARIILCCMIIVTLTGATVSGEVINDTKKADSDNRKLNVSILQMPILDSPDALEYLRNKVDELMGGAVRPELVLGVECGLGFRPYTIDSDFIIFLGAIAKKHSIYFIPGTFQDKSGDKIYNSCPIFGPDGSLIKIYRKKAPYYPVGSEITPGPSDDYAIFKIPGKNITVGLIICYDQFFPEISRTLALKGAEMILCPSYDPAGKVIYKCGKEETTYTATLDFNKVTEKRLYGVDQHLNILRYLKLKYPYTGSLETAPVYKDWPSLTLNRAEFDKRVMEIGMNSMPRVTDKEMQAEQDKVMDELMKNLKN